MREAAGYVLFHREVDGLRILLLRNARHRSWGYPKGHLEPGETHETAARRELGEETGIEAIEPISDFDEESTYDLPPPPGAPEDAEAETKHVRYFLAEAPDPAFRRSPEHDAGGWMMPEEAIALLGHEDLRRILRAALARLKS